MPVEEGKENEEDDIPVEIDGRLSAIMPRRLFLDDAAVKSGLLQVYVRMKPVPEPTETCMQLDQNQMLKATWRNKEAVYKFSRIFQQECDQADVYQGTTAALVDDLLQQRQPAAVVMAYGVTNAGKTFTMQGAADKPGLVPQALAHIFKGCNSTMHVSLSVMEIYNECIHDLLAQPHVRAKPASLRLKEDKTGQVVVQGLSEVGVSSMREAQELLRRAAKARQSSGTNANERSSRSHAVITVRVRQVNGSSNTQDTPASVAAPPTGGLLARLQQQQQQQQQQRQCQLCFVDLAGCERVKRTGNSGARLRESVAINSSLMTLARCLEVLRYNQQHPADQKVIPYRESKITHLFKDVLHGNGRFVMVVNVSPAAEEFNETKRVLQYAALASKVTMTSEVEHDILVGPDGAWGTAATAATGQPPAAAGAASAEALAAAEAAAAAARGALSSAQARIEELLDDKADLEYEVDVVERKVELLREELIKAEVEKEQLEAEIRAEVAADMQALLDAAAADHKATADKAALQLAAATQTAAALQDKVNSLEQQLQDAVAKREAVAKQLQSTVVPDVHAMLMKSAAATAAAKATQQAQAEHAAEVALLVQHHQQQLHTLQSELLSLHQQLATAHQNQQQQQVQAQAAAAAAASQMAQLHAVAAEAVALVQSNLVQQQQQQEQVMGAGVGQLQHVVEQLQAWVKQQQQVQKEQQKEQQQQQQQSIEQQAAGTISQAAAAGDVPADTAAGFASVPVHPPTYDGNCQQQQQQQQQQSVPQLQQELQQPEQRATVSPCELQPAVQQQPAQHGRAARSSRRATLAPSAARPATVAAPKRRRQTLAAAVAVGSAAVVEQAVPADGAACSHPAPCAGLGTLTEAADEGDEQGPEATAAATQEAVAAAGGAATGQAATTTAVCRHAQQATRTKGSRKRPAGQLQVEHPHDHHQQQQQQAEDVAGADGSKRARRVSAVVQSSSRATCNQTAAAAGSGEDGLGLTAAATDAGPGSEQAAVTGAAVAAEAGAEAAVPAADAGKTKHKQQRCKTLAAVNKQQGQPRQQQRARRGAATGAAAPPAAGGSGLLPTVEEEDSGFGQQSSPQQQQQQQREEEVWQSAELVLGEVTSQQQLGPVVRGRRATIAAIGCAGGTAAAADVSDDEAAAVAAAGGSGGDIGRAGKSSRGRKRCLLGPQDSKGAGGSAGGGSGLKEQQLQQVGGGVTPVAFRTRHRGR